MLNHTFKSKKVVLGFKGAALANALTKLGIESTCLDNLAPLGEHHCDWNDIKRLSGFDELKRACQASDLIALVEWANLRNAETIWEGILRDILKPSGRKDFMFLFDLNDLSNKTPFEIDEILDLISSYSFYGRVTLSLNRNEALSIWSSLTGHSQNVCVEEAARFIHYAMDIDRLLIHLPDKTIVFQRKEIIELKGPIVGKPEIQKESDCMNAGFILGLLFTLSLEESMILGMAASGACIEEGTRPTLADVQHFLSMWRSELETTQISTTPKAA